MDVSSTESRVFRQVGGCVQHKVECDGVRFSKGLSGESVSQVESQRGKALGLATVQGTSTYSPTQGRNVGCGGHTAWQDSSWTKLGGRSKEWKGHRTLSHRPA